MTRTASQKARARARRAQQNAMLAKPIPVQPQPQRQPRQRRNRVVNSQQSSVQSSGSIITVNAPVRRQNITSTYFKVIGDVIFKGKRALKIQARDYIASVPMQTSGTVGSAAVNVIISPSASPFTNTRLGRFCSLYEKYVFTNIVFEVDTGAGSSVNGNYMIAYDKDPSDPTPQNGDGGIREYSAWEGTQMFPAGVNGRIAFPLSDPQDFYYTNPGDAASSDERLYAQGQVYIVYGTQVWSTNISLGLYMEYEILLFDPEFGSLTSDGYMTTNSYTPSTTNGQAWPVAAIPDANVNTVGEGIRRWLDNTGTYRGFQLDQGQYFLEQIFGNNTGVQTILNCLLTANDPTKQALCVIQNLQQIPSVAGGTAARTDRITVPVGGAILQGTVNVATATTGAGIRVLNPALSGNII